MMDRPVLARSVSIRFAVPAAAPPAPAPAPAPPPLPPPAPLPAALPAPRAPPAPPPAPEDFSSPEPAEIVAGGPPSGAVVVTIGYDSRITCSRPSPIVHL